jgi:hypothetical protein
MNRRKNVLGAAIALGVIVPVMLSGCGGAGGLGGMAGGIPGVGGKCPDLSKPEAILAFDFASNFKSSSHAAAKLKASAKCEGTCTGKCTAEFKEPKCTGEVTPPKMSADCKAHCDASISAKAECTPAQVGVVASGGADLKALETLKLTLEKNLPLVLKVAVGMGEKSIKMAGNAKTVIEGTMSSMTEIAGSGGGQAALTVGQLTACLGDTFKGAIGAAGSLQANVSVSVNVSASASGSAGGSGKGGTGESLSSQ